MINVLEQKTSTLVVHRKKQFSNHTSVWLDRDQGTVTCKGVRHLHSLNFKLQNIEKVLYIKICIIAVCQVPDKIIEAAGMCRKAMMEMEMMC